MLVGMLHGKTSELQNGKIWFRFHNLDDFIITCFCSTRLRKKQVRRVRSEKFCPSFCATLLLVQKDQLKAKAPWHENVIQAMGKEGDI
jgi:hypothetical protein